LLPTVDETRAQLSLKRKTLRATQVSALALICLGASELHARSLVAVLKDPAFAELDLAPLGPALADTVASTYPVASASSSVTYVYNPALETFERRTGVAGPIIGERADTIGQGQFNLGFSYSYVGLTQINGDDMDSLVNTPVVDGQVISFPVPGGVTLENGQFTNFLPVRVKLDLDVQAHLFTPSLTYGLTPDLDVNLTLPLLYTSLEVRAKTEVPDPRLPEFTLAPGDPNMSQGRISDSESAFGIGDILLRSKYVLRRGKPFDVAGLLGLSLPSGDEDDFRGMGDTRVQPLLIASRVFAERYQPFVNVGVDLNANDVDRSVVRWSVGGTAQIIAPLTAAVVFLGRHELARQTDKIQTPFFFQIERNDSFDASVGLRYRFTDSGVVSVNTIVPLNDEGLRAEAIPTFQVEYAF
jgi:hypothetical protein